MVVIGSALAPIMAATGCASTQSPAPAAADPGPRMVLVTPLGRSISTTDLDPGQKVRVQATPLAVMSGLTQVYADLKIPIGTMTTSSGQVGNINLRVPSHSIGGTPLSAYLSCGQGSSLSGNLADLGEVTISVLSTVVAVGDSASLVTTEVAGRARSVGQSTDQLQCQSNGGLERRINVSLALIMRSGTTAPH